MDKVKNMVLKEYTKQMEERIELLNTTVAGFSKLPEGVKRYYATFGVDIVSELALNQAKSTFDINAIKCIKESISPEWMPGKVKKLYETNYVSEITNEGFGAPIPKGVRDANFTYLTIGAYKTGFGLTWEEYQTEMSSTEEAFMVLNGFSNKIAENLKKEVADIIRDNVVEVINAGEFNYENYQKAMTTINRGKTSTELQLLVSPEGFDEHKVIKYEDKRNMVYAESMIVENNLSSSARTARVAGRYDLIEIDEFREFTLDGEETNPDEGKIVVYVTDGYAIDYSHTGRIIVDMPVWKPETDVFSGVMRFPYGLKELPGAKIYKLEFDKEKVTTKKASTKTVETKEEDKK